MGLRDWLRGRNARRAADDADNATSDQAEADAALDPFAPFPDPVRVRVTDVFDLHTIAPRDVRRAVAAYLEEAHRRGFRSVRLIHGKGRYVQRANVRAILARTPFVRDWTDAPPEAGGTGATIAHLHPKGDQAR
ncbi:MAG TPA: Smr/MutS family protein [Pyrinomonadaceae bacterium]|jgi:hypothetical protein